MTSIVSWHISLRVISLHRETVARSVTILKRETRAGVEDGEGTLSGPRILRGAETPRILPSYPPVLERRVLQGSSDAAPARNLTVVSGEAARGIKLISNFNSAPTKDDAEK